MEEVRCRHCGAFFTAWAKGAICPYCGEEASSRFRISLSDVGRFLWVWIWILLVFSPGRFGLSDVVTYAVLAGLVGLFLWRQQLGRKPGRFHQGPITLDLGANPGILNHSALPSRMRRPEIPRVWQALISARRPREISLRPEGWLGFLGEGIFALFPLYEYLAGVHRHAVPVAQLLSFRGDRVGTAWMVVYVIAFGLHLKQLLDGREIVRDGEVTIGYVQAESKTATFQFCTTTGDWFEGRSAIHSRDVIEKGSATPIFYMPEDPRKNVALFATGYRVQLPEDENSRDLRNAPAKS